MTTLSATLGSPGTPAIRSGSRRTFVLLTLYLIILWTLTAAGRYVPNLVRQDKYDDDASQHVWWAYQYADPQLFPHDEMLRFMSGPPCAPPGYKLVFRVFAPIFDAQRVSETVPFVLSALLFVTVALIGYQVGGGGAVAVFLCMVASSKFYLDHMQGGFPRAYGLLIMLFAMWALMARRLGWLGVAFLAAGLFYPPALVPPAMCAIVTLGWDLLKTRKMPKGWLLLGVLSVIAVGMLLAFIKGLPPEFGPITPPEVARTLPEFQPHGRAEFFGVTWQHFIFDSPLSGFGQSMKEVLAFAGLIVLSVLIFGNFLPREAWLLQIGSLLSFIAAHLLLFKMHVPNRHVQYPLVVFRLIWIAALAKPILARLKKQIDRRPPLAKLQPRVVVIGLMIALIFIGASSIRTMNKNLNKSVDQDMENALSFIRTLPKDTLVAAHPFDGDKVPLRTQRSVLGMWETYHPYWVGYYHYIQPRVEAEDKAFYASDWTEVQALHDRFGVKVFLVDADRYWSNVSIWFCEPYTGENMRRVEIGRQKGFALLNPPAGSVIYRSGRVSVVRLSP